MTMDEKIEAVLQAADPLKWLTAAQLSYRIGYLSPASMEAVLNTTKAISYLEVSDDDPARYRLKKASVHSSELPVIIPGTTELVVVRETYGKMPIGHTSVVLEYSKKTPFIARIFSPTGASCIVNINDMEIVEKKP